MVEVDDIGMGQLLMNAYLVDELADKKSTFYLTRSSSFFFGIILTT